MTSSIVSASTTYGIGLFAMLFSHDLTTYAAAAGLVLVVLRIIGDVPKVIGAWKKLFTGDTDGSNDE